MLLQLSEHASPGLDEQICQQLTDKIITGDFTDG